MPSRLNLAGLTAEELQRLLGEAAAQRLLPQTTRARLEGKPLPGSVVPPELSFEAQGERGWGATPEAARALSRLCADLSALGGLDLGVYSLPHLADARHQRALLFAPDIALALRWSETPEAGAPPSPFLVAVTLLRDRASGTAAVLSSSGELPLVPTPSEEVDARLHLGATPAALLEAHRQQVARHGRGVRLQGASNWMRAFQTVWQLNLEAWERRGLLSASG